MKTCPYCSEEIFENEKIRTMGKDYHIECSTRMVIGSVAHIQKKCSCYIKGSKENDPEGMSLRQAAHVAFEELQKQYYD